MKIDIFNHIFPKKFYDKYIDAGHGGKDIGKRVSNIQTIVDVDSRFRILDEFGDYVQVITLPLPPVETLAGPEQSPELAREGNDGLAELVKKHDRFLGFAASLPMNNPKAAEKEMTRALDELGAFGIQMYTNAAGKPLDSPESFQDSFGVIDAVHTHAEQRSFDAQLRAQSCTLFTGLA